jgi:hypothetical protein
MTSRDVEALVAFVVGAVTNEGTLFGSKGKLMCVVQA